MANVPASKPQYSKAQVIALIAASGLPTDIPEKLFLVGVRGYYQDSMGEKGKNDRGIYDDAVFIVSPDFFASFNANTDPSVHRPATASKQGIAVLKPGLHYYRKGKHKINSPNGYPAFRPDNKTEELPVTRDGQGDSMGVAINIHKGSIGTTSSEGCQTIYPTQWKDFQPVLYDLMDKLKQKRLPYYLIEHGA